MNRPFQSQTNSAAAKIRLGSVDETIGLRVAELRRAKGICTAELARRVPMSRQSLSYIERGLRVPKVRVLLPILAALGLRGIITDVTIPGRRIRALRKLYLLTGTEFGRLVKAEGKQLFQWERGQIVPNLSALRRICSIFGLGLDFFFGRTLQVS